MIFWKKIADMRNMKGVLVLKKICFQKLHMCVYLQTKFQVPRMILTSFRQNRGWGFVISNAKRAPKKPTQIRVKKSVA